MIDKFYNFIVFEFAAYIVFSILNTKFFPGDGTDVDPEGYDLTIARVSKEFFNFNIENAKGLLERSMLVIGLNCAIPQVVIVFGALKIGSRFDQHNKCKATTNYFVIGNLLSIIFAFLITQWAPLHWR